MLRGRYGGFLRMLHRPFCASCGCGFGVRVYPCRGVVLTDCGREPSWGVLFRAMFAEGDIPGDESRSCGEDLCELDSGFAIEAFVDKCFCVFVLSITHRQCL